MDRRLEVDSGTHPVRRIRDIPRTPRSSHDAGSPSGLLWSLPHGLREAAPRAGAASGFTCSLSRRTPSPKRTRFQFFRSKGGSDAQWGLGWRVEMAGTTDATTSRVLGQSSRGSKENGSGMPMAIFFKSGCAGFRR